MRAEAAWLAALRRAGGVLGAAARSVRVRPLPYGACAVALVLATLAGKLLPFSRLDGVFLYATAWSWTVLRMLLVLALVIVATEAVLRGERGRPFVVPGFWGRFLRALPYGLCYVLCFDQAGALLAWGLQRLAGALVGGDFPALWTATYHAAALVPLFLLSRFGFTLAGAAAGDRVSFRRSWALSGPAASALFLTALLWWAARRFPSGILVTGISAHPAVMFYFRWLDLPVRSCVAVAGWAVGAAWYRELRREGGEEPRQGG